MWLVKEIERLRVYLCSFVSLRRVHGNLFRPLKIVTSISFPIFRVTLYIIRVLWIFVIYWLYQKFLKIRSQVINEYRRVERERNEINEFTRAQKDTASSIIQIIQRIQNFITRKANVRSHNANSARRERISMQKEACFFPRARKLFP